MKRAALVILLGVAGCGTTTKTVTTPTPAPPVPHVGPCQANGLLPDRACTPGALNPDVTQATINQTICVSGWTATIRPPQSVTRPLKVQGEIAYGIPGPHPHPFVEEENDHLIPLELGGSPASPQNLWPEAAPGYHAKDGVENRLKHEVCAGTITLAAAQQAIASNWETAP